MGAVHNPTVGQYGPITIYRNDGKALNSNNYSLSDTDIEDGKEYIYTFYSGGNKYSVALTAIKPAYYKDRKQTSALELVNYEENANKDYVVTAENINVYTDSNKVYVQVPQKDYLSYAVKLYKGNSLVLNLPEKADDTAIDVDDKPNPTSPRVALKFKDTDKIETYCATTVSAGEYKVEVTVDAYDNFYKQDKIVAATSVKIEPLETGSTKTSNVKAAFTNTKNKNVRVEWTPAKQKDVKGDNLAASWPTANYKVFGYDDANCKIFTEVNGDVKASTKDGKDVYYVDTATVKNYYVVVLSDNEKYEDITSLDDITSNKLVWYEQDTVNSVTVRAFFTKQTCKITISGYVKNDARNEPTLKYVIFNPDETDYSSNDYSSLFVDADLETGKLTGVRPFEGADYISSYECDIKDVPEGCKVAYQVTVTQTGKKAYVKSGVSSGESYK